jgi:hypothetical protein
MENNFMISIGGNSILRSTGVSVARELVDEVGIEVE